jgi:transketolase
VPSAGNPDTFTGAGYHGPFAPEFDRFIISPAHYALVIYSALIETARMDETALDHFNKDGSSVEMIGAEHGPGMEALAQGLSMAAGIGWARLKKSEPGKVWVYMSDGEFQEGQTWETMAAMSHHGISNLRVVVDVNRQQCDGGRWRRPFSPVTRERFLPTGSLPLNAVRDDGLRKCRGGGCGTGWRLGHGWRRSVVNVAAT